MISSSKMVLCIIVLVFLLVLILLVNHFALHKNVPIYVVSLERERERRENVKRQLKDLNYTIYNAVDGKNLNEVQHQLMVNYIVPHKLNPGQVGCFLSHLSLWKQIIETQTPCALILEDDINVISPLNLMLPKLCKVEGFDILYLGHYFEPSKGEFVQTVGKYAVHKSTRPYCTHAYMITYNGAKALVDYLNKHKASQPIDNLMLEAYQKGLVRSMSVYPTLVDQNGAESTINEKI